MARAHWTDDEACDLVLDEDWHAIQADAAHDQADDPLAVRCHKCGAPARTPCRNYLGHRKPTCKARGTPLPPEPAPTSGSWFDADIPD
jgi:hypothetical protein